MDRGVTTYSAAYIAGITTGCMASPHFLLPATLLALSLLFSYITKRKALLFLAFSHIALFSAGVGASSLASLQSELPQGRARSTTAAKCAQIRHAAADYLKYIIPDKKEHATLCALAIGEKGLMEKSVKEEFSKAGAMHVLALSGLHIGIVFAIIYRLLSILCLIPGGDKVRDAVSLLFILGYTVMSGCSPSVVRAALMILIYKIAKGSFRHTGKWDAIALSAMVMGTIDPMAIKSIGFQLSYSAVTGIALLFPTCRWAFSAISSGWKCSRFITRMAKMGWECVAIAVCCQIATFPLALYYFGNIPQWFLLSNIIAVPAATAILYLTVISVALHAVPYADAISAEMLSFMIRLLNSSVGYISS